MKQKICCVCRKKIESEEPAILTMTALATPKFLCSECEESFDKATLAKTAEEIDEGISKIAESMEGASNDDPLVLKTVTEILENAAERKALISDGIYDFSNDEIAQSEMEDEVPEELKETEEDRELDKKDAAFQKKFDKIINYVMLLCFIAFLAFVIYRLIVIFG